jgi:lycopene cyclase domain-containing protein
MVGQYTYLFLILIWAGPVIIFQWLLGLDLMIRRWKVWSLGIVIPTVYLTVLDSIPLNSKTWTIAPEYSTGIMLPLGVPLEEGVFFLVTNTLVVQGMILFCAPGVLARMRRAWRLLRRGPSALTQPDRQAAPDTIKVK